MNRTRRLITTSVAALGAFALIGGVIAAPKAKHHNNNGKQLLGEKIKKNGCCFPRSNRPILAI